MKNYGKYKRGYFMPPAASYDWMSKEYVDQAPVWCSVDLRDGNQALVTPMSLEDKLAFFTYLVKLGFKEIEIGFPAASDTEYEFARRLIDGKLIPSDVTVQVLTQARDHIIKKTFDAIDGAENAIVHLYNSTSAAQREQVFRKDKAEIIKIATDGAQLLVELSKNRSGNIRYEYSPESFTGTEMDYALEICNAVIDVFKPRADKKLVINCPSTVSLSLPHVYASQIEYISKNLKHRDAVVLSAHPHNDRGTAVAEAELALLAGADRLEGTLFGNGERTGNLDLVTVAMNLYSHGIDPGLDFSDMPAVVNNYEKYTGMTVPPRQPYGGSLVFTAFSGSHQDAITKGLHFRKDHEKKFWDVPYLMIDPEDIGRNYEADVIRINSQSGKGGIGFLLESKYGFVLPPKMREEFGYKVKSVSDKSHKELGYEDIYSVFEEEYINVGYPVKLNDFTFMKAEGKIKIVMHIDYLDKPFTLTESGNGQLDATSNALKDALGIQFTTKVYTEHALEQGSASRAAAYIGIEDQTGAVYYAAGLDTDIMTASIKAMVGAVNKMFAHKS